MAPLNCGSTTWPCHTQTDVPEPSTLAVFRSRPHRPGRLRLAPQMADWANYHAAQPRLQSPVGSSGRKTLIGRSTTPRNRAFVPGRFAGRKHDWANYHAAQTSHSSPAGSSGQSADWANYRGDGQIGPSSPAGSPGRNSDWANYRGDRSGLVPGRLARPERLIGRTTRPPRPSPPARPAGTLIGRYRRRPTAGPPRPACPAEGADWANYRRRPPRPRPRPARPAGTLIGRTTTPATGFDPGRLPGRNMIGRTTAHRNLGLRPRPGSSGRRRLIGQPQPTCETRGSWPPSVRSTLV